MNKLLIFALALMFVMMLGPLAQPVAAQRPSCDTSGTTVVFLGETCEDTTCTWEYEVCQTGFALSHWVLGLCACLENYITEVGYIDAQDNKTVMLQCTGGQTTPCWEFGLDPTTGLFGLKWDNLPGPENECWLFYFTIDRDLGEAALNWTSKFAACAPGTGTITGPACDCGDGRIIAFKYYDVNRNGVYDQGDYELEGWQISLDDDQKTTDAMGFVDFGLLSPGEYTICETLQDGWFSTEPDGGTLCHTVNLNASEQIRLHFGNYEVDPEPGYIRASKYYDYNRNGICDDPGCPLNDWEICLQVDGEDCKTTRDICMLCGGCTDYWEVEPGTHTLCEIPKDGWINTDPGVTPACKEVTVEPGQFVCVPFGNWEPPVVDGKDESDGGEDGIPVGGTVYPLDKATLLAPWLSLAAAIITGSAILLMRRRAHS